ncbi:SID1 transmembrane family member 2-like [Parambassis ranga]|uniref:SID1 transmembrane family member 2-like n=1 Tax=Parambassis ranga TaxID=210632 RepID=A0A6P7JGG0_9TELE|nr:SID1 transmembrane family member 2-like [Parambassis ranga]
MVLLVMGCLWPNDFASYLLAIAICNLLLYFAFYIIMKLRSGERIKCLPLVCILFTAVVWGFALYFFFQGLSTWQKTPAELCERNRDCILLSFFDDHDIWHFLSSIAMFGSFLVLLTMDNDLDTVQRQDLRLVDLSSIFCEELNCSSLPYRPCLHLHLLHVLISTASSLFLRLSTSASLPLVAN